MKLIWKIVLGVAATPVVLAAGAYAYISATWHKTYPDHPRPAVKASSDPEVIARGKYLVEAVAHCSACHGPAANVKARKVDFAASLVGGYEWDVAPFGRFFAANITSDPETGIGRLSDGDLARAIGKGIGRNGDILAFMQLAVGPMADEDLTAIVSYLRTLAPVKQQNGIDELGIVGKLVAKKLGPRAAAPPPYVPAGGVSVERGRYLANGPAVCVGCHSELDPMNGFAMIGEPFAGSREAEPDLTDPAYEIATPNLTPDPETGHVTNWTEEAFVARFKAGTQFAGSKMPWPNFALMTEDDVRSIYRYLRTLPPVKRKIGPPRRPVGTEID